MIVQLDRVDEWLDIPIPGSSPAVRLHRLHVDPETGASVSLVRFPAGWSRPVIGFYAAAEEFVVLEGEIRVGRSYRAGDYAYLPPRTIRAASASESGALALAWFSAPPAWTEGEPPTPPPGEPVVVSGADRAAAPVRQDAPEVPGSYRIAAGPVVGVGRGCDVWCPQRREWEWVPPGQVGELTSPSLHVRTWA
jgi:quercetin dioxygenase-like cupin family protein